MCIVLLLSGDRAILTGNFRLIYRRISSSKKKRGRFSKQNYTYNTARIEEMSTTPFLRVNSIRLLPLPPDQSDGMLFDTLLDTYRTQLFDAITSKPLHPKLSHLSSIVTQAILLVLVAASSRRRIEENQRVGLNVLLLIDKNSDIKFVQTCSPLRAISLLLSGGVYWHEAPFPFAPTENINPGQQEFGSIGVEAGATVMANQNICCIEAVEEWCESATFVSHLSSALCHQSFYLFNHNNQIMMPCHTSIIASTTPNPAGDSRCYEFDKLLEENLKEIGSSLVHSFDLHLRIEERKLKTAEDEVLDMSAAMSDIAGDTKHLLQRSQSASCSKAPLLTLSQTRTLISLISQLDPVWTSQSLKHFHDLFASLYLENTNFSTRVSLKTHHTIMQLAAARARLDWREVIHVRDVELAFLILKHSMIDHYGQDGIPNQILGGYHRMSSASSVAAIIKPLSAKEKELLYHQMSVEKSKGLNGEKVFSIGDIENLIRGLGLFKSKEQVENTIVTMMEGQPSMIIMAGGGKYKIV